MFTPAGQESTEQARSADSFVDSIGINVHLTYLDTAYVNYVDYIKPRLQELGIRHIRDGGFSNREYINKLNELSTIGIKSTLQFFGTPIERVVDITKQLKGSIEAVEGPNESDLKQYNFSYKNQEFPEGTRLYQKDLYQAMKNNDETKYLPILFPSMGHGENAQKLGYLEWGNLCNLHSYPNLGNPPTDGLDWYYIRHGRIICGQNKPIVVTETGYHNLMKEQLGVSEIAASKYISRLLFEYFNRRIQRTYLYELIDEKPDPEKSNIQQHYGLLLNDGSKKPAFEAIKNLIFLLQDSGSNFNPGSLSYSLVGDTKDIHHTLLQKINGVFYLVIWQEVKSWDNDNKKDITFPDRHLVLNLNTPIEQGLIYQPIKSLNPTEKYKIPPEKITQISLKVPDYPLVIELLPLK